MNRWRHMLILIGTVLVLGLSSLTMKGNQRIVDEGHRVLLPLDTVDPRSLMQGDFMRLRYDRDIYPDGSTAASLPWQGTVILAVDSEGVGRYTRPDDGAELAPGEVRIAYRKTGRGGLVRYGADSFFFQEGDAYLYDVARFGVLRVDEDGATVLVGLARADGSLIVPNP